MAKATSKVKLTVELHPIKGGGFYVEVPGERVPPDLEKAIDASSGATAGWEAMSPAHRREHVKHVTEAKKPETRERRIGTTIAALEEHARKRRKER